jgi:hypothetical protein
MRHYEIQGSILLPGEQYRRNMICHVIADSASRAMTLVLEKHPGIDIWRLEHRGSIDVIDDRKVDR